MGFMCWAGLSFISNCFLLLEVLDLSNLENFEFEDNQEEVEHLSLTFFKLQKVNLCGHHYIDDKLLIRLFKNCKLLEQVMLNCSYITFDGVASAIRLPLTRLVLQDCTGYSYSGIFYLLSKSQHFQHLDLRNAVFLTDKHVVELSLFLGDLVSINLDYCSLLTISAFFALIKSCPSLSDIKMKQTSIGNKSLENSKSLMDCTARPQLKYLHLARNPWLTDENVIMFASIAPNLQLLDLSGCRGIFEEGIAQVLRLCCNIRHLNLSECLRVKLLEWNFKVPKLEVLNLSETNVDDETLYVISKCFPGLLQLLLNYCTDVTVKGMEHVVGNCTQLRDIVCYGINREERNKWLAKQIIH
ncbi:hypothetical protein TSUD_407110 [Trifolium subterraneum]|uniref:F-box/LRR-repeat protein 15-like leucin rich repeat domain-containing protein n=1 Tax=Trifolium subterraneum TaxID=3900 RepID=A0A2Z6NY90_TRISU|nr:hypothetical protein TSUD_407110 [Trifolium subterraneum]